MKRNALLIFICLITAHAWCVDNGTQRYRDIVFSNVQVDSVQYCAHGGHGLLMDIYQPTGDTATARPLVILAHGGSFMHGDRKCDRQPALCNALAQRGYVAVSIDYRLTTLALMAAKGSAYKAIIKSVADGRSSIAWFLNDIAHNNVYRIDAKKIFFGGSSAGAILAEQLMFMDSSSTCAPVLHKAQATCLPVAGALPPGTLRGVISLAGAVLDTSIIRPASPALLHIHGDNDRIVPYGYKRAVNGLAPFKMVGLGGSRDRYISQHINFTEYVFKNAGHTPWDGDDKALEIIIQQISDFLWKQIR